jgi:hypothetical protein
MGFVLAIFRSWQVVVAGEDSSLISNVPLSNGILENGQIHLRVLLLLFYSELLQSNSVLLKQFYSGSHGFLYYEA